MSTATKKPAVLRDSWRLRETRDRRAWLRRGARRLAFTAALIGLAGWLFYLLFSPFWHPYAQLVCLTGGSYQPLAVPPLAYASEDVEALIKSGSASLLSLDEDPSGAGLRVIESADDFARLADALGDRRLGSSDVLIVYLTAHGISEDGRAYFLCRDFDPRSPTAGRYPLDNLLGQLQESSAGVKLLLLDAGRLDYDPRLGLVVNEFARLLNEAVTRTNDPRLWVLTANSPLERSWVSPAWKQSVFGHAVSRGLAGEADLNGDKMVDLDELYRFTTALVSQLVRAEFGGRVTQTPQLIASVARPVRDGDVSPVLVPARQTLFPRQADSSRDASRKKDAEPGQPKPTAADSNQVARSDKVAIRNVGYRGERLLAQGSDRPAGDSALEAAASNQSEGQGLSGQNGARVDQKTASGSAADSSPRTANDTASDTGSDAARSRPPDAALLDAKDPPIEAMLNLAWRLRDYLERRDLELAGAERPRPLDEVPHLWRAEVEYLLDLENRFHAGQIADQASLRDSLREELIGLNQLANAASVTSGAIAAKIAQAMPTRTLGNATVRSVAMAERAAAFQGAPLDPKLRNAIVTFDAAIRAENREPLDRWISTSPASLLRQYYEFWLARQLAGWEGVPWSTVRLALECARAGETVASDSFADHPTIRRRVALAESERLDGLRRTFDQIGTDWNAVAEQRLTTATRQYREVLQDLSELHAAQKLRNELLFRLRDYLRWRHSLVGSAELNSLDGELESLVSTLSQLSETLASVEEVHVNVVMGLRWQIEDLQSRLDATWQQLGSESVPDEDAARRRWLVPLLLSTPLPSAPARQRLRASVALRLEPKRFSPVVPRAAEYPRVLTDDDWAAPTRQMNLERQLVSLTQMAADGFGEFAPSREDAWSLFSRHGSALQRFYRELPGQIEIEMPAVSSASNLRDRSDFKAKLGRLDVAWRLIDGRDAVAWETLSVTSALRGMELYETLARLRLRALDAMQDATTAELTYHGEAAADLGAAATSLFLQPGMPPPAPPPIRWEGPTSASLAVAPQRQFDLTLSAPGNSPTPVWLHVDYDLSLIELRIQPSLGIQRRDQLTETLQTQVTDFEHAWSQATAASPEFAAAEQQWASARDATRYPYRADAAKLEPTIRLEPGVGQTFSVTIGRTAKSGRTTKLIFKAVCNGQTVRHEVGIPLPGHQDLQLAVEGPSGGWTETSEGLVLHPWPNRETEFQLGLINEGALAKSVDIDVLALDRRLPVTIPNRLLPADAAANLLGQLGPNQTLTRIGPLSIPADGRAVPLPLAIPNGAEAAKPADPSASSEVKSDGPPSTSVRHGIVLVITNIETGERLFRRVDFRPRRPRSYVQPSVGYDPISERLTIDITPLDPSWVPAEGIPIRAEFADPLPRTQAQLSSVIQPPNHIARMSAHVPSVAGQEVTVYLHVDEFPRAFVYHVPCWRASRNLTESRDRLRARIVSPSETAAYLAPIESVPVHIEVDAPPGAFENDRDVLEVGWDLNRDREFTGESPLRIHADRQAEVLLESFSPSGGLRLSTKVSDFQINVPGAGLGDTRVNLLARVTVGESTAWSDEVELIFDASGPRVNRIMVTSAGPLVTGENLDVQVTADDFNLSGVAAVEVGFDLEGTGRFSETVPPIPAVRSPAGDWRADVPTADVQGAVTLLARATDRVGKFSEFAKYPVEIVSAEQFAAMKQQQTNRVSGTIVFGKMPLAGANVVLQNEKGESFEPVKTDADGFFRIPGVPAGKYRLSASGVARNRPRMAEAEVTVDPPPAPPVRLELRAE